MASLAIASATWQMFEVLGIADRLAGHGCAIHAIKVSDGGQAGELDFVTSPEDRALGTMVENRRLRLALAAALGEAPLVRLFMPSTVVHRDMGTHGVTLTLGDGTRGNGPPKRRNGLGTDIMLVEGVDQTSSFRFTNTRPLQDPPDPRDSVWVFAQGLGVKMTEPDPNPKKKDAGHIWIYPLDDIDWPVNTTAYLLLPQQTIVLEWPTGSGFHCWLRQWMQGDK